MAALTSAAHTAPTIPDCEPQPPLMKYWSENDILRLVQDYRRHPCLWNPQFPTYNNKMIREIEWRCIKRSLVYKCKKTFSILEIKRKIRRLLLIYKRYRRPHCLSRFQPWYAFHHMNDFLEHREIREDEEFVEYQQPIILAVQNIEVVNLDPDPTPSAVENESPVQDPCVTSQVNSSNVVTNVSDNQQCQLQQQPEQQQQQLFQQQWQQLKQQHQQQWQQLQQQQQLQQFRQQWQQWKQQQLELQLQLQEPQEQVSQEHQEQEPQQEHEEEPQQQQERKQLQKPQQKKQQKKPKLQRQQQERKQLQKPQQKKQQKKPKLQRQQQERKQLQKPQQKKQQKKPKLQRQQRWLRSSSQEQQRWLRSSTQHRQEQQQQQQRLLRSSPQQRKKRQRQQQRLHRSTPQQRKEQQRQQQRLLRSSPQQRKKQQRQQQRLLRSSPQPQKQYSENSDDCGLFGKFVALKMRKMSQERREAITIQINKCFYNEMKNSKTSHK